MNGANRVVGIIAAIGSAVATFLFIKFLPLERLILPLGLFLSICAILVAFSLIPPLRDRVKPKMVLFLKKYGVWAAIILATVGLWSNWSRIKIAYRDRNYAKPTYELTNVDPFARSVKALSANQTNRIAEWQLTWWTTPESKLKYQGAPSKAVHTAHITKAYDPVEKKIGFTIETQYTDRINGLIVFDLQPSKVGNGNLYHWHNEVVTDDSGNYYIMPDPEDSDQNNPRRFFGGYTMWPSVTDGFIQFKLERIN